MKRILLTTILNALAIYTIAQHKDVDRANLLLKDKNLIPAKKCIDSVVVKYPGYPRAWYLKAKIYNAIALDPQLSDKYPDIRTEAFNALKKYSDTDDKFLIDLQIDGYKPINDIYTGYYATAALSFNQKDYEKGYSNFVNAISVSRFMTEKKWINMGLDTNSVLYAGVSAEKLGKMDEAATYYSMLIEAKAKGDGFVEIYKWVANHYFDKKDYERSIRYLKIGEAVYPGDPYWPALSLDITRETADKKQLFARYEEIIASNPDNHLYRYNYAVELYQEGYNVDPKKRPVNSVALIDKAKESVKQAIRLQPGYSKAQLFAGQIEYNEGIEKLKANKEEVVKKFDEAIPYFLQVEKLLDSRGKLLIQEKEDLKEAFDLLVTIYDKKGMSDKVKEYEAKFNSVDKKH